MGGGIMPIQVIVYMVFMAIGVITTVVGLAVASIKVEEYFLNR
jgi:hypothetical protein